MTHTNNPETVGVGIVTYKRPFLLAKLLKSLLPCDFILDHIVVVDDGGNLSPSEFLTEKWLKEHTEWITNEENIGVGRSKNKAFRALMNKGCDHIFIIEDDIFIKSESVFDQYINASKLTGIQHFNYSQHGIMNKTFDGNKDPNPRITINYGEGKDIALYPHCVGAFSYYSKKCLEEVGIIDERYVNACEHVDHTYEVIKAGMHPPFWYFADLALSHTLLGDEPWTIEKSTISSKPNHQQMMKDADKIFVNKHGCLPMQIPLVDPMVAAKELKRIKKEYGQG
jgi:GT2 family glycosyltransferase